MAARTRRRDSSGHMDPFSPRRKRFEAVLKPLGLWELFAAMPRRAQELFVLKKFPDPVLEFDASFPADAEHRALRKELEAGFRATTIFIDDAEVSFRDFYAVMGSLKAVIKGSVEQPGWPEPCLKFMRESGPLLEHW